MFKFKDSNRMTAGELEKYIGELEQEVEKLKKYYDRDKEELTESCYSLSKENKNLKLIIETNEKQIQNDIKERDELREENKKLKERIKEHCNGYEELGI